MHADAEKPNYYQEYRDNPVQVTRHSEYRKVKIAESIHTYALYTSYFGIGLTATGLAMQSPLHFLASSSMGSSLILWGGSIALFTGLISMAAGSIQEYLRTAYQADLRTAAPISFESPITGVGTDPIIPPLESKKSSTNTLGTGMALRAVSTGCLLAAAGLITNIGYQATTKHISMDKALQASHHTIHIATYLVLAAVAMAALAVIEEVYSLSEKQTAAKTQQTSTDEDTALGKTLKAPTSLSAFFNSRTSTRTAALAGTTGMAMGAYNGNLMVVATGATLAALSLIISALLLNEELYGVRDKKHIPKKESDDQNGTEIKRKNSLNYDRISRWSGVATAGMLAAGFSAMNGWIMLSAAIPAIISSITFCLDTYNRGLDNDTLPPRKKHQVNGLTMATVGTAGIVGTLSGALYSGDALSSAHLMGLTIAASFVFAGIAFTLVNRGIEAVSDCRSASTLNYAYLPGS